MKILYSLAFLFHTLSAPAAYITLVGEPKIEFTASNPQQVKISGTYSIANQGDESAQQVFPSIQIGSWAWAGDPRFIKANEKTEWKIQTRVPLEKFFDTGKKLPATGLYPAIVTRHYQDLNGYALSAMDILPAMIGRLTEEQTTLIRLAEIDGKFTAQGNGQKFKAIAEFNNHSTSPHQAHIRYIVPRELKTDIQSTEIKIPAGSKGEHSVQILNDRGIDGSGYAVFVVAEWENQGLRNATWASTVIAINKVTYAWEWAVAIVFITLLLALFVYFKAIRRD